MFVGYKHNIKESNQIKTNRNKMAISRQLIIRYNKFMEKINTNNTIQKYFNIADVKLSFSLDMNKNNLFFTISYLEKFSHDLIDLPNEMSNVIMSFLNSNMVAKFQITFPESYPFDPPFWTLVNVENELNKSFDLDVYFQTIVNLQNCQNYAHWSPAIDVEKEILGFITKMEIEELKQ